MRRHNPRQTLSTLFTFIMKTLSLLLLQCFSGIVTIGATASGCPELELNNTSSPSELVSLMTHPCRYDVLVRPTSLQGGPLLVKAKMYAYYLQMTHYTNLQFKVQMLVQLHWRDERLLYQNISRLPEVVGQKALLERIWFPHVFVSNGKESSVMGLMEADQTVSILPQGDVLFSTRLQTLLTCQTEEGKFPFDQQMCHLVMDNWRYNLSYVVLAWEGVTPVIILPSVTSELTEFDLTGVSAATSDNHTTSDTFRTTLAIFLRLFFFYDLLLRWNDISLVTLTLDGEKKPVTYAGICCCCGDCDHWGNETNLNSENGQTCGIRKSSLIVKFYFNRKFSFYFWDYYGPSVLLVVTSWGSFWVHPEVVPCRVWLATCTMLGFFGLGAMNDAMPKLSHLKMNDIWFIGCNLFIFLSLAEFAFVNIVHRQATKHIPLKRASSKYILKSSLRSEQVSWKRKSSSCPTSPELRRQMKAVLADKYRQQKNVGFHLAISELTRDKKLKRRLMQRRKAFSGVHMTNHEMAHWIDMRSRFIFPLAFVIFNVLFWCVMFIQ